MTFDVRGKSFEITFVNNYVREQYNEMLLVTEDLAATPDEVAELPTDDSQPSRKKRRESRLRRRELVRRISDLREDMLRELLETNGYDYDRGWWMHKTDAEDINEFVFSCNQKDVQSTPSKKK